VAMSRSGLGRRSSTSLRAVSFGTSFVSLLDCRADCWRSGLVLVDEKFMGAVVIDTNVF
jgi:hypothetical protein